jgi:hypothetical protein
MAGKSVVERTVRPLGYLLSLMHDPNLGTRTRMAAATAALPYFHRKLPRQVNSAAAAGPFIPRTILVRDPDLAK